MFACPLSRSRRTSTGSSSWTAMVHLFRWPTLETVNPRPLADRRRRIHRPLRAGLMNELVWLTPKGPFDAPGRLLGLTGVQVPLVEGTDRARVGPDRPEPGLRRPAIASNASSRTVPEPASSTTAVVDAVDRPPRPGRPPDGRGRRVLDRQRRPVAWFDSIG